MNEDNRMNAEEMNDSPKELFTVGIESEEIRLEQSKKRTREEEEVELFRQFERYRKNRQLLWGQIIGVEAPDENNGRRPWLILLYSGATVKIPDIAFFEDSYDFGKDYPEMKEKEKVLRRREHASRYIGARVPFIVAGIGRKPIEDSERYDSEQSRIVIGDRKTAMAMLRDIYFFHKEAAEGAHVIDAKSGDITTARVLQVGVERVLVECCGVETRMDRFSLNDENVENCHDFVENSDEIRVKIRKLHKNEGNPPSVYLAVTGRLNVTSKALLTMREGSYFLGKVDGYNRTTQTYSIRLKNGVNASVKRTSVYNGQHLVNGDVVSVMVTKILPTFVVGNAMKVGSR